jgi:hypothetical protein
VGEYNVVGLGCLRVLQRFELRSNAHLSAMKLREDGAPKFDMATCARV